MKRILFVVLFALSAVPAFAQNQSTTQMALVGSAQFTNRLQYLMAEQARTVMFENQSDASHGETNSGADALDRNYTAACHTQRVAYAKTVIQSPGGTALAAAVLIVSANFADAVIAGATITGTDGTTDIVSTSDLAILNAIVHDWNVFAQCSTFQ
jgi:3-keto-L-gulonate-6-phosphate decarboxylase